jgi:hypothetical protein
MARLNTLLVTFLKPSRQHRSFRFQIHFFCITLAILAFSAGFTFANETPRRPITGAITKASQIRSMTIEQAKQGKPVHLKAVITYYDPEEPDLFIQDASAGIWVNLEVVKPNAPLTVGDIVEIQGVTEAPDFAPQVGGPVFKVVGRAPLPPARRVSFAQMSSTQEDRQRVEVEGIVHKVFRGKVLSYIWR